MTTYQSFENDLNKKEVLCFALMPLKNEETYKRAINPAIEQLKPSFGDVELQLLRADEEYATQADKVEEIKQRIRKADLIIVDITGLHPNVLWELGYSQALNKHIIIIGQDKVPLPFNIADRDVIEYTNDEDGINKLTKILVREILKLKEAILNNQSCFLNTQDALETDKTVKEVLNRIRINSLLDRLVLRELKHTEDKMDLLGYGRYEIKHEPSIEGIVEILCEYLSRHTSAGSEFDAVSYFEFWRDVTQSNRTNGYIKANIRAAKNGAKIRRLFVVNKETFNTNTEEDKLLKQILRTHKDRTFRFRDNIELRIHQSTNYFDDMERIYRNFGILRTRGESLLFLFGYSKDEKRRLENADFYYCSEKDKTSRPARENFDFLVRYQNNFEDLWEESSPLTDEYLD